MWITGQPKYTPTALGDGLHLQRKGRLTQRNVYMSKELAIFPVKGQIVNMAL